MSAGPLLALFLLYAELSLLAVGGGNTVLPEMQRQVVLVHGWMGAPEFASLYALAQAAPGPNMLVSTLVGQRVAGLPGAFAATAGMIAPSCLLTAVVAGLWQRFRDRAWRRRVQAGLTPVTVGLVMAAAVLIARSTTHGAGTVALTLASAATLLATRLSPLWMLAAGAALGAAGVV